MPTFFPFTQGSEWRARPQESSPLLGRFRAVPPPAGSARGRSARGLSLLSDRLAGGHGSVHVGYGALVAAELEAEAEVDAIPGHGHDHDFDDDDDDDDENISSNNSKLRSWSRAWRRWVVDLWLHPRQTAVRAAVDRRWSRYGLLVLLPAVLAVAWCSLPFPQYPLPRDDGPDGGDGREDPQPRPGHGAARVQVDFWFFLFVYYGLYNLTALIWITKVFNLYSLNWWPQSLGFPLTVLLIAVLSLAVPIPVQLSDETRFLTRHNTSWISWTFIVMAMPVAIAFAILMTNKRHLGPHQALSETQRIFTSSWWTVGEGLTATPARAARRRRSWLPASFVRFLWFCVALSIGLMAYLIGEAYAELYLGTLPHNNLETVVYVYGWVVTVHLLDALTGWVLGIREGERVGSYPLSWVFKLYFMLTYQTYVRALYARLRSPSQFVVLQALSSTSLVVITPLMMTRRFHRALSLVGLNRQSYGSYQKLQMRNVFLRFLAENATMATFLGSVLVLHFGANKDVYPYFAFDDAAEPYDLRLTFYASAVSWACELAASLAVRGLVRLCFGCDVGLEGLMDLAVWPELLPTSVAVTLHVLQNMLFSIVRLQFRQ